MFMLRFFFTSLDQYRNGTEKLKDYKNETLVHKKVNFPTQETEIGL